MKKGLLGIMLGVFALVGVGAIPALAAPSYVNTDTGGWGNMDQVEIGAKSRISESDNT
ncbi:MAG: hypothetical protein LBI53_00760 [Candidatus Peribacteria bacterium]|jgi:hypothetical protein|nr:hypothetical protein [Candidatus Peribacteria bacterium]